MSVVYQCPAVDGISVAVDEISVAIDGISYPTEARETMPFLT